MRAIVVHAPRDLRLDELDAPAPGPGEVRLRMAVGGICGSDLHYYQHGGFGTVRLRQPMALGHEVSGVVEAAGAGVEGLPVGTRVALNPSMPCGHCRFCLEGNQRQCLDMRFLGSAMRFPHVGGGFREMMTVPAAQAVPVADGVPLAHAAMAEPLSVCLHAARQAGTLLGRRVLVTGSGPIGVLCAAVARLGGAEEVVVTDVVAAPLAIARAMGATQALDVGADPEALSPWRAEKGLFDVAFECSGNAAALRGALDVLRPGGVAVQVGVGGDATLPLNLVVAKEITLRGTFRFDAEFALAVSLLGSGRIDPAPMVTATLPMAEATAAFELAGDRTRAMKVQIAF